MPVFCRLAIAVLFAFLLSTTANAQSQPDDLRQEYVRSSSPTKNGSRVISESVGGRRMVRIARGPGTNAKANEASPATADRESSTREKYMYPDRDTEQVTAFRQAANQPPQLRFPQQNRFAQCNCNGVPVPAQQLQFPSQNFGLAGFQAQPNTAFQQPSFQPQPLQPAFGAGQGYPLQSGIGVPQFNQTGGNWWTPFISGSGYYTPLINFRNMPQGTYLGQGIIGQPTAYVDGQPFRNLLRYISP